MGSSGLIGGVSLCSCESRRTKMQRWRTNQKQSIRVLVVVVLWCVFLCHSTGVWSRAFSFKVVDARIDARPGNSKLVRPASSFDTSFDNSKRDSTPPDCFQQNASSGTKAKGIIKIATIGPRPLNVDVNTEPQKIVDKMIAHWRSRFAQVLPDRPDLIVVPEACDRPAGFGLDKRLEYYRVRKDQVQKFFAQVA